ncbi:MAG: hypothetical protein ACOC10_09980, partial [Bacteroidota bacterium]
MKRMKDLKIGTRLNIILSAAFVVIMLGIGLYVLNIQKHNKLSDTDQRMFEQVTDLTEIITNEVEA